MKILVTWSKWHASMGESFIWAFRELGYEAEIFYDNPSHWALAISKILWRTPFQKKSSVPLLWYQKFISDRLFKKVKEWRPDFIFVIKGIYFLPNVIRQIRDEFKIPVANWIIDDPAMSNIYDPPLLHNLQAYSHFFIIDESWSWYFKFVNASPVFYLPHAGDEKIYRPLNQVKDFDLFFIGSLSPQYPNTTSGILRALILNYLVNHNFKVTAVAPGLNKMVKFYPNLSKINLISDYQRADKVNEFYNRAKIVLNINAPQLKTDFSDRLFTIALSKSFQLVDFKNKLFECLE